MCCNRVAVTFKCSHTSYSRRWRSESPCTNVSWKAARRNLRVIFRFFSFETIPAQNTHAHMYECLVEDCIKKFKGDFQVVFVSFSLYNKDASRNESAIFKFVFVLTQSTRTCRCPWKNMSRNLKVIFRSGPAASAGVLALCRRAPECTPAITKYSPNSMDGFHGWGG